MTKIRIGANNKQILAENGDTLFLFKFDDNTGFGTDPIAPGKTITFRTNSADEPLAFSGQVPFTDPNPTTNTPLTITNQVGSFAYSLAWAGEEIPLFLSVTQTGVEAAEYFLGGDGKWRIGLTIKSTTQVQVFLVNNLGSVSVDFNVYELPEFLPVLVLPDGTNRFRVALNPGLYRVTYNENPELDHQTGGTDEADIIIDP